MNLTDYIAEKYADNAEFWKGYSDALHRRIAELKLKLNAPKLGDNPELEEKYINEVLIPEVWSEVCSEESSPDESVVATAVLRYYGYYVAPRNYYSVSNRLMLLAEHCLLNNLDARIIEEVAKDRIMECYNLERDN